MPTVSFNTHFPGYDILGEISRSNARVLKARHIASGDIVAIKHFSLNTDADTLRRFERESEIMTQMAHPNIVRVREIRLDADLPYIVMEYVEGGSVRQLITEQGCLSVETTIRLGLQVLDAFRAIHTLGIVHRDVKPENILYHSLASGELHFLIADFGVARLHEQPVTVTGQSLMTYEYAAPEQFDNPRQVDAAVDYYALGVVLYECLTGKVPFAMRNETGIVTFMNTVLTTPPPAPVLTNNRTLPESLATLLQQMLAKNPVERIHTPDAVKLALKQAELEQLRGEQSSAASTMKPPESGDRPMPNPAKVTQSPRPPSQPTVRPVADNHQPSRSRPTRRLLVLGLGSLLVLGLIGYWLTANPGPRTKPLADHPIVTTPTTQKPASATELAVDAQQRIEAARRQYQQQVLAAAKKLNVSTFGARVGLFGGIKGLSIRLKNPSPIPFRSVQVTVRYVKEKGSLFKTATLTFDRVGPYATLTKRAPDSPRGTQFSARLANYQADLPDSLTAPSDL